MKDTFDRRQLLKYFGAGAVIVPVIGGSVDTSSAAQLIEVPKVRPVELAQSIPSDVMLSSVRRVSVLFETGNGYDGGIIQRRIDGNFIGPDSLEATYNPSATGVVPFGERVYMEVRFFALKSPRSEPIGKILQDGVLA